jgi:hypothetical protein
VATSLNLDESLKSGSVPAAERKLGGLGDADEFGEDADHPTSSAVDFFARLWFKECMRTWSTTLQLSRPAL